MTPDPQKIEKWPEQEVTHLLAHLQKDFNFYLSKIVEKFSLSRFVSELMISPKVIFQLHCTSERSSLLAIFLQVGIKFLEF